MYTWVSNEYSNEYANKLPHHMVTYILKGVLTKKSLDSRYFLSYLRMYHALGTKDQQ